MRATQSKIKKQRLLIIEKYSKILTATEIGIKLKISKDYVDSLAQKNGISLKKVKPTANNKIKIEKFKNIKNKEVAYLLGFMWADGASNSYNGEIKSVKINFLKEDFDALEKTLSKFIDWHITFYKPKNGSLQAGLYSSHPQFCSFLQKLNYKNKSHDSPSLILSKIPIKLHNYFWRGYFDGDGCIHLPINSPGGKQAKIIIVSTINYDWSCLEKLFKKLLIEKYKIDEVTSKNGHKHSRIYFNKRKYVKRFCDYLYGDKYDGIGLKRKYNKFESFLKANSGYDFERNYGLKFKPNIKNPWLTYGKNAHYIGYFRTEKQAIAARDAYNNSLTKS